MNNTVFALDEGGQFETREENSLSYVLGLMYNSPSKRDIKNESKRVENYLRWICKSADVAYPRGLHEDRTTGGSNSSKAISRIVRETLPDFIKTGQYPEETDDASELEARKGYYRFAVNVAGKEGKSHFHNESDFLNYDFMGSNLYVHMAEDLVVRALFHNPYQRVNFVTLRIAQRSLPLDSIKMNPEEKAQQKKIQDKLHYRIIVVQEKQPKKDENGQVIKKDGKIQYKYFQTRRIVPSNSDTYRTVISRERARSLSGNPQINSFWCASIPYEFQDIPKQGEFMFLADLACVYVTHYCKQKNSDENNRISKVREVLLRLSDSPSYVMGYDDIDDAFMNAWDAVSRGDYFSALSASYDAVQTESGFKKYYSETMFPLIKERIIKERDERLLARSIEDLEHYTNCSEDLDQNKLRSLLDTYYEILSEVMKGNSEKDSIKISPDIQFRYFLVGQAAYNHIGSPNLADKYFEYAENISDSISLDLQLLARRQKTVSELDRFRAETVLDYAKDTVKAYEEIQAIEKKRFHIQSSKLKNDVEYGMALSQAGQVYAFMRKKEAEQYFIAALKEFGGSESNYYRTLTYLIHHYIDMRDYEKYCKSAPLLFGRKRNNKAQYEWLLQQVGKSNPFTLDYLLYVYLKAQYVFFKDQAVTLPDFNQDFDKCGISRKEHPWELIEKYIALIELEKELEAGKDHEYSSQLLNRTTEALAETGYATSAIIRYGYIQYAEQLCENCDKQIIDLYRRIHSLPKKQAVNAAAAKKDLETCRFTYMYI